MRIGVLVVGSLVLAGVSAVLVAPAPAYDPWSWLIWGREVADGTLSTAEGPAFKPLPVAVTTLLSVFGDAAPTLWVLLARAAAFVAIGLAFVLGRDLADGRTSAGALAAIGVALCGAYPTYAASGDVTGLLLALALGGVIAWRAGRVHLAFALAVGCALLRVEAWPFLAILGVLLWRRGSRVGLVALLVPAAWLVPEWLGSGEVLRSGARARIPNPGQPALADVPGLASLTIALELALVPLTVAGLVALAARGPARALAATGAAWIVLVALMAQLGGFSGEARYALPGAALLAVAGAVTLARLPRAALTLAVVAVAVAALPRLADLPELRRLQAHQQRLHDDLDRALATAGGRDAVLRCGTPYVGPLRGPLMAYVLDVTKETVEPDAAPRPPGVVFSSRRRPQDPVEPAATGGVRVGVWHVTARCS